MEESWLDLQMRVMPGSVVQARVCVNFYSTNYHGSVNGVVWVATWSHDGICKPPCSRGDDVLSDLCGHLSHDDILATLPARTTYESVVLIQPGSVLISMVHVTTEGHKDV